MRVVVCGDRAWRNYRVVKSRLAQLPRNSIIIEGEARGADSLARLAAETLGLGVMRFPAQWTLYGRAAGPIRNRQMLQEGKPDLVIAFHEDLRKSRGTRDMVRQARKAGVPVEVIRQ